MRSRGLYFSINIILGVSSTVNAQRLHELTPYSFYQNWTLVSKDYHENLIIYKSKDQVRSEKSNSVLKFKRRNHVFYLEKSKPLKKKALSSGQIHPKNLLRKVLGAILELERKMKLKPES